LTVENRKERGVVKGTASKRTQAEWVLGYSRRTVTGEERKKRKQIGKMRGFSVTLAKGCRSGAESKKNGLG